MKVTKRTRLLAMVISLMMIVATFPMGMITVSAEPTATVNPQGQAINSAEDFAKMLANGTYYLAEDIELSETYATTFTGTFDGNGKTITTSVPMFKVVESATIQNFTVTGNNPITQVVAFTKSYQVDEKGSATGAVACMACDSTFENIVNEADIEVSGVTGKSFYGGIVGIILAANDTTTSTTTTFKNCINKGALTEATMTNSHGGGIVGADWPGPNKNVDIEIINCGNEGDIVSAKAAGMLAYIQHTNRLSIVDCYNTGDMTATDMASGIFGHAAGTTQIGEFLRCSNNGIINGSGSGTAGIVAYSNKCNSIAVIDCSNSGEVTGSNKFAAGIIAYCVGQISANNANIVCCSNSGTISHGGDGSYIGGIVGQLSNNGTVENCVNSGIIGTVEAKNGAQGAAGIAGHLTASNVGSTIVKNCANVGDVYAGWNYAAGLVGVLEPQTYLMNCYTSGAIEGKVVDGKTLKEAQICVLHRSSDPRVVANNWYNSEKNVGMSWYSLNEGATEAQANAATVGTFSNSDLASGQLTYDINDAAGETVFYQNINEGGAPEDAHPVTDPTHGYVFKNGEKLYSLAFYTLQSASVRLDGVERAMRFATAVNKNDYDFLTKNENGPKLTFTFGTLITPDDYLEVAGYDFTKDKLDKLKFENSDAKAYLDVTAGAFIENLRGEDNDTYYYFCGTISEIAQRNYEWDYSAIGYVTINGNTMYSGQYATRNIAYVANAALNDTTANYTDSELDIIRGYLPQN